MNAPSHALQSRGTLIWGTDSYVFSRPFLHVSMAKSVAKSISEIICVCIRPFLQHIYYDKTFNMALLLPVKAAR